MSTRQDSDRVTELEVRVAHQDRLIAELDEVVREFSARVQRLERQVVELSSAEEVPVAPVDEAPPHY